MTIKMEAGSSPEAISRGSQVFKALTRLSKGFGLALRLLAWNKQGRGEITIRNINSNEQTSLMMSV